jgi:hypothetical protein
MRQQGLSVAAVTILGPTYNLQGAALNIAVEDMSKVQPTQ